MSLVCVGELDICAHISSAVEFRALPSVRSSRQSPSQFTNIHVALSISQFLSFRLTG